MYRLRNLLLILLVGLILVVGIAIKHRQPIRRLDTLSWSGIRDALSGVSQERRPTTQPPSSTAKNKDRGSTHRLASVKSSLHTPTRPNVIFMMADDLGYGDVHYNGGNADTPNLDAMAAGPNSVLLTRYYAGAPVCSPTRGSVLTGRNPNRYCIWKANEMHGKPDFVVGSQHPLPPSEITIAEILKEQGYHTAVFGKWHLGDLKQVDGGNEKWPVSHPGMHGFDSWWVTPASTPTFQPNCACFDESHCSEHNHYGSAFTSCMNYYTIDSSNTNQLKGWPEPVAGDDSLFLYERLSEYLESVSKTSKPFFIYFPFHTVHKWYLASSQYQKLYQSRNYSLNEADYYGAISAMDEVVGKIQTLLHQYNVYNNTMLWFTSDNGPAYNSPGQTAGLRGRKQTLWEGGIRVPGIIQWPDVIQENRESNFPVVSSDLLPTVCDILGVDLPSDRPMDGISVLPFLRGEATQRNKSIAWAYTRFNRTHAYALTRGRYKVYTEYDNVKVIRKNLYDIVSDKAESKDIFARRKKLFESMKTELDRWRKSIIESATKEVKCV